MVPLYFQKKIQHFLNACELSKNLGLQACSLKLKIFPFLIFSNYQNFRINPAAVNSRHFHTLVGSTRQFRTRATPFKPQKSVSSTKIRLFHTNPSVLHKSVSSTQSPDRFALLYKNFFCPLFNLNRFKIFLFIFFNL